MQGQCWGQCQGKPAWGPVIWKKKKKIDAKVIKLRLNSICFLYDPSVQRVKSVSASPLCVSLCRNPKPNSYLLSNASPPLMSLLLQNWWHQPCANFTSLFTRRQTCGPLMFWAQTRSLEVWTFSCFALKMCRLGAKQLRNVQTVCKYVCVSARVVSSPDSKQAHLHEHHDMIVIWHFL